MFPSSAASGERESAPPGARFGRGRNDPGLATHGTNPPLRRYPLRVAEGERQAMSESGKDEFAELSGRQEKTVRQARRWVQSMVKEAGKSDLHLQMVALEMMTHGLGILTGKDAETARADVMRMFSDEAGGAHLTLRKMPAQAAPEPSGKTAADAGKRARGRAAA
jgi:hypothetical protein